MKGSAGFKGKPDYPLGQVLGWGDVPYWRTWKRDENEEDFSGSTELQAGQGTGGAVSSEKGGTAALTQRPGKADAPNLTGLRRDAENTYDQFVRNLPQRNDQWGNLITPETQFGGGPDPRVTRLYPGIGDVYQKTYGQVARELGFDPHAFVASGGFIGRGSQYAGASRGGMQLRNMIDNPTTYASQEGFMTGLTDLQELQKLMRQYFAMGGAGMPTPPIGNLRRQRGAVNPAATQMGLSRV